MMLRVITIQIVIALELIPEALGGIQFNAVTRVIAGHGEFVKRRINGINNFPSSQYYRKLCCTVLQVANIMFVLQR